ncbi:MAG: threonine/serine dehydratase [Kordiimonadaceae bacterium]|nr:threonine/serine dehydratase [Kordiimonadaceae bacterium]
MGLAVSYDDIVAAAKRIEGVAVKTPLIESPALNALVGGRVLLKAENLQRVGAFKFRGAFNRLSQLSDDEKAKGVVAWSSGNHAQGVAAAGQILDIKTTIIMPEDTPKMKLDNTRGYGASVTLYNRYTESREDIGRDLAAATGATIVPPYDDPHIVAGQGTVGLEIMAQAKEIGAEIDAVFVPCGGGGLTAGTSIAVCSQKPDTEIYTVEPEDFDDVARSFVSGKVENADMTNSSICDALLTPYACDLTFSFMQKYVTKGLTIRDDEAREAVQFSWEKLKLVVELGGAAALAAVMNGKIDCKGKTVAVILSGGNVDAEMFSACIGGK